MGKLSRRDRDVQLQRRKSVRIVAEGRPTNQNSTKGDPADEPLAVNELASSDARRQERWPRAGQLHSTIRPQSHSTWRDGRRHDGSGVNQ